LGRKIKTVSLRGIKESRPYQRDEHLVTTDDAVEFFNPVLGVKRWLKKAELGRLSV
jgi:hypothetical protein